VLTETEYKTAQQAAVRLGVTPRAIQKWAAAGKLPGAVKHGKSWLIPQNATTTEETQVGDHTIPNSMPDVYQLSPFRVAMPLLNSPYPIGKALEYIEAMPDPDDKSIALGRPLKSAHTCVFPSEPFIVILIQYTPSWAY